MSAAFADCAECGTRNSLFNPRCIGCGQRLAEGGERRAQATNTAAAPSHGSGPASVGPYEVVSLVGMGSSARVFAARHAESGEEVLLKVMRPELLGSGEARTRFDREARALARVRHPHIARVLDVLEGPSPTLVLEIAPGRSLEARLADGPLPSDQALRVVTQLAMGLSALHAQGVVHRDVKPANIMVSDQLDVKLIDLGLARMLEERPGSFRTAAGAVLGSLAYAAPEVVMGERGAAPADCWSLGVVAFELATGRRPFDAPSRVALAAAIVAHRAADLHIEGSLGEAVRLCLQHDAAARPSAADLAAMLTRE